MNSLSIYYLVEETKICSEDHRETTSFLSRSRQRNTELGNKNIALPLENYVKQYWAKHVPSLDLHFISYKIQLIIFIIYILWAQRLHGR
jgi:hypothetical protein